MKSKYNIVLKILSYAGLSLFMAYLFNNHAFDFSSKLIKSFFLFLVINTLSITGAICFLEKFVDYLKTKNTKKEE